MSASEIVIENLERASSWTKVRMEFSLLFSDLIDDPRYSKRVMHIEKLLEETQCTQPSKSVSSNEHTVSDE
jgi:hypothetical protein